MTYSFLSDTTLVLIEALPYIQRFANKIVVIKYGGNALAGTDQETGIDSFAKDIALLHAVGIKPVVVHGGGPQISSLMERLGKTPRFQNGLRVTDAETMEIVSMVLLGTVNPQIVAAINVHGTPAVGVSGQDANMFSVSERDPELGFVGEIAQVDPLIVLQLLAANRVPVVATIGTDANGQSYNINADTAAAELAIALGAEKLIYLTDIEGLRSSLETADSIIPRATCREVKAMLDTAAISGGMVPKIESSIVALEGGVGKVHILDGRIDHVVLLELFTDAGVGTMIELP